MSKILTIFCFFMITPVYAQNIDKAPLPPFLYEQLIKPLLQEVPEITKLNLPKEEPKVFISSRESIEELYCKNGKNTCHVAAVTDDKTGEILLSPALIMQINVFTASVVFHELVHFTQIKNHLFENESNCKHWAKSEMHAYTAQSNFLIKHGVSGFEVPNLLRQCK